MEVLRAMFARHGLPEQLVSDNGPQFTSSEFEQFLKGNCIKHILSAPYHPASNGLAERFIQTLKCTLKASEKDGKTLQHRLAEFLFEYRATPHATTNESPSELFLKRRIRTRFDLMLPNTKEVVTSHQAEQKKHHDKHAKDRSLFPGTEVMVRDYIGSNKWIPGIVLDKLGPVTYSVEIENGRIFKRHIEQLRVRNPTPNPSQDNPTSQGNSTIQDNSYYPEAIDEVLPIPPPNIQEEPVQPPARRYPQRQRRAPDHYTDTGH